MKNKKVTYILLSFVVIIWVLIFVRIFRFMSPEPVVSYKDTPEQDILDTLENRDTVTLIADYPDPFIQNTVRKRNTASSVNTAKRSLPSQVQEKEIPVSRPKIIYLGTVQHTSSGKVTGMAIIENEEILIMENHTYDGIHIEKLYQDSVMLTFNQRKETIKK